MMLEEFEFVKWDFIFFLKENIFYLYFKIIIFFEIDMIFNVIFKCDDYLENYIDIFIFDIKVLFEGILFVEKEYNFEFVWEKVIYIWDRFLEVDELFWNDILILRNIFFIFENEIV